MHDMLIKSELRNAADGDNFAGACKIIVKAKAVRMRELNVNPKPMINRKLPAKESFP